MKPKVRNIKSKYTLGNLFIVMAMLWLTFQSSTVYAQANQNVVNGGFTKPVVFSELGCKYTWTNSDPSIGLPAAGTGDIASFKAINNGTVPVTATITGTTTPISTVSYLSNIYSSPGTNVFTVVDPTTLQKQNTIGIGNATFYHASVDGNTLYFISSTTPSNIIAVNAITNKIIATIPINYPSHGNLLFSSDGSKIYLIVNGINPYASVLVINAATNAVESTIDFIGVERPNLVIPSPDGSKLYALLGNTAIAVYSTINNSFAANLSLPETKPIKISLTPDGNSLIVQFNSGNIYIIDTKTGISTPVSIPGFTGSAKYNTPTVLITADSKHAYLTYTPNPFFVTDQKYYLFAVDIPSGAVSSIQTDANTFTVTLSPDGKQLALFDGDGGQITLINTATRTVSATVKVDPTLTPVLFEEIVRKAIVSYSYDGSMLYVDYDVFNKVSLGAASYMTIINTGTGTILNASVPLVNGDRIISPTPPTGCGGAPVRFNITVYPDAPIIHASGTLPAMKTSYGTPSASSSFTVSGSKINIGILVTPPPGFEVSIDNNNFVDSVKVGPGPTVPITQVYIRLKSSATVGTHSGDIIVSNGPTIVNIATAPSEVTAVPLTITANNISKIYGVKLATTLASTEFTSTGLKNGETIGTVVLTYAAGAAATDGVGAYTASVTPSAATDGTFLASNYIITYEKSDLNVTPAVLTITAENKTRYFKEDNPQLTVTYSGFVNNETVAVLTTLPTLSTTANQTSPIGTYTITATGAAAANYTMVYKPGVLTIEAKPVIVTNAFTPNDDGINDTWDIKNINEYPGCTVEVFNRYGQKLYYSLGYTIPWEGKFNGQKLPVGTYYYIIKLDIGVKPLTGYLAIIR